MKKWCSTRCSVLWEVAIERKLSRLLSLAHSNDALSLCSFLNVVHTQNMCPLCEGYGVENGGGIELSLS